MAYIFISYNYRDREYVHRLAASLEAKGFAVWIDDRIDYGETWPDVIEAQVDGCSALIVVMTHASHKSKWVKNELSRAQRKGKSVFPLLLEGDVWLSVEATQYVDVLNGSLPSERFYSGLASVMSAEQPQPKPAKPVEPTRPDLLVIDKPLRLELVRVPAGEFMMGTRTEEIAGLMKAYGGEQTWYEWEAPQHRLALSEYTIGKAPVTLRIERRHIIKRPAYMPVTARCMNANAAMTRKRLTAKIVHPRPAFLATPGVTRQSQSNTQPEVCPAA